MIQRTFLFLIILFCHAVCQAQESVSGDSTVVKPISLVLSEMYGKRDSMFFLLTKSQLQKIRTVGSQLTVEKKGGKITRIVISSFAETGKFEEEYFFKDEKLIFVYQTSTYFSEASPVSQAVNFMKMRYWENRFYFVDQQLKFQKTTGLIENERKYSATDLLKEKDRLLKFLEKKGIKA